jgi:outer membrane protein assembly factor BamB
MRKSSALLRFHLAIALLFVAAAARADGPYWPQFRGPGGQGHSDATMLPMEWTPQDNVVWRTPIEGRGHSSPVVMNDQVWVTTAAPDGTALGAVGVDYETGEILHSIIIFTPDRSEIEEIHQDNTYASPTPCITEGRLFCHFGTYGTACVDTATGDVLWRNNDLKIEHQGGPGSSPVLYEDLLIIPCDGADHMYVIALDTATGQPRWRRERSAPFRDDPINHRAFSTPLLVEHEGEPMVISIGADQAHGYDPRTGDELWHVRYVGFSNVPAPVYGDGFTYLCTGFYDTELWAVDVSGQGDVTESHVSWRFGGPVSQTPSPLLVDGRIYLLSDTGVLTCIDAATGDRLWVQRFGGNFCSSPLYADGKVYICSEEGETHIFVPGSEKPEDFMTNSLPGGINASPVAVEHSLLIRTDEALYRIEEQ